MTQATPLSAREVYQLLKDVALGLRAMELSAVREPGTDIGQVQIEGWQLRFYTDSNKLQRCAHCQAPDGRTASLDHWQRFGSNPVDLLSKWEHEQLERLLSADGDNTDRL